MRCKGASLEVLFRTFSSFLEGEAYADTGLYEEAISGEATCDHGGLGELLTDWMEQGTDRKSTSPDDIIKCLTNPRRVYV